MKAQIRTLSMSLFSLSLAGCLASGGTSNSIENNVLVSEVVTICGAIVGDQAEQRINQEWDKYPEASANRPIIENIAEALLNDPNASAQQRSKNYRNYLTCATGLLMSKGYIK